MVRERFQLGQLLARLKMRYVSRPSQCIPVNSLLDHWHICRAAESQTLCLCTSSLSRLCAGATHITPRKVTLGSIQAQQTTICQHPAAEQKSALEAKPLGKDQARSKEQRSTDMQSPAGQVRLLAPESLNYKATT